jgi:hypothetical protein
MKRLGELRLGRRQVGRTVLAVPPDLDQLSVLSRFGDPV